MERQSVNLQAERGKLKLSVNKSRDTGYKFEFTV